MRKPLCLTGALISLYVFLVPYVPAGTNPPPEITGLAATGENWRVELSVRPGKVIELLASTNLTDWQSMQTLSPSVSNFAFTAPGSLAGVQFFGSASWPGTNPPVWAWTHDYPLAFSPHQTTNLFLQWRPPSDLLEITGYRIYQDDVLVADLAATTFTYAISGLETGRLYRFRIEAGNEDNNWTSNGLALAVRPAPGDPTSMASVPGNGIPTSVGDSIRFLFEATNSVQTGADTNELVSYRLALLRGRVLDAASNALEGVALSILGHPAYGITLTRTNGEYDLAVNGGGVLTLLFNRYGFLPAQRTLDVPWQETVDIPDVFLLQSDTNQSIVELTNGPVMQVARGPVVSDADGTRSAMVLLPTNVLASIITYGGVTQPVDRLTTRFTEYTEGEIGAEAMPGDLPDSVAYTYCVELGSQEAQAKVAGRDVVFNTNAFFYVDNFLGFPPGIAVPMGYYDNQSGAWVPSPDGVVINLLGTNDLGLARVCANTNGTESDAAELAMLGFTDDERRTLARMYSPTTNSLWRVPIQHFSTYDCNYGVVPEDGAEEPDVPPAEGADVVPNPDVDCGNSGIEMENQTLTENLRVPGTPYYLVYSSQFASQNPKLRKLRIPVSGATLPTNAIAIRVKLNVAGKKYAYELPAQTNQFLDFQWDGKDGYGREVRGVQTIAYSVEYLYPGFYALPPTVKSSFGTASGRPVPGMIRSREPAVLRRNFKSSIGTLDAATRGLGGWMLDVHHVYDPVNKIVYLGSGRLCKGLPIIKRSYEPDWMVERFAGTGEKGFSGDGGPAHKARLDSPKGLCVGPDGSVYVADCVNDRVRKIDPHGIITTVAGTWPLPDELGDGGYATHARLVLPSHVACAPDGSLYIIADHRIRRVKLDLISTFAGTGVVGTRIPGVPATSLDFDPTGLAVAKDGTVFAADAWTNLVWRIGPNGLAEIAAGFPDVYCGFDGDNLPARESRLCNPRGLAVNRAGQLLIADYDNNRVRLLTPSGFLQTFAGNGAYTNYGDGGAATDAGVRNPTSIAAGRDGSVFVAQHWGIGNRLRQVLPDGRIITVLGDGTDPYAFGILAKRVQLMGGELYVASAPDGTLYVSDYAGNCVYRLRPTTRPMEQEDTLVVASEDASQLYVFDLNGRHLRTVDVLTGATNLTFSYTADGLLDTIQDVDGRITRIHRDGNGKPTSIEAPSGQKLTLALDSNDYLRTATYPDTAQYQMTYSNTMLASFTRPRGNTSRYTYDDEGNLVRYVRLNGGTGHLARVSGSSGWTVTHTNPAGVVQTYETELTSLGGQWSRVRFACGCGADSDTYTGPDGLISNVTINGDMQVSQSGPDPRFGMQSPAVAWSRYRSPLGLELAITNTRAAVIPDEDVPQQFTYLTNISTVNGRTYVTVIDRAQRTQVETTPMGRTNVTRFDAKGRVASMRFADLAETLFGYDANGCVSSIVVRASSSERRAVFVNDDRGNVVQSVDPESVPTYFQYSAGNWLTNTVRSTEAATAYSRDLEGNILAVRSPAGKTHTFAYTPANLLARYYTPAAGGISNLTEWTYNAADVLTAVAYADGTSEEMAYDSAGRVVWHGYGTNGETYSYGGPIGGNQLTKVEASNGVTVERLYDGALLLEEKWSGPVTGSVSRGYDNNLWITNLAVNGAEIARFGYDLDGLLTNAGDLAINRNAENGLVTGTRLGVVTDVYQYNAFSEVTNYSVSVNGSNLYSVAYERDGLGRITRQIAAYGAGVRTNVYNYDPAHRYLEVVTNGTTLRWSFDPDGNRTNFSRDGVTVAEGEFDGQDRIVRWDTNTYGFSARGTLATSVVAGIVSRYHYNTPGALLGVTRDAGSVTNIAYTVDGLGRRIARYVNGVRSHGFLYSDSLRPVAMLDALNGISALFVHAAAGGCPAYMVVTGRAYRIISDHLGSPLFVVDSVTGAIAQRMTYDTWGTVLSDTHPLFQPFGFAGGLFDPETGLLRFGVRDYDPAIGRWTARDPMLIPQEMNNAYAYCGNDPVNQADLEGTVTKEWVLVIRVNGKVYSALQDGSKWDPVYQSRMLKEGDSIYVAPNSKAKVRTSDNSVFEITTGDEGKLIHPTYFINQMPEPTMDDYLKILNRTLNKFLKKKNTYDIKSPNCAMASRG